MADANARMAAVDPRRRVDRSKYVDPEMPEFPGAVFINHIGCRTAQVGAGIGCLVLAPVAWMRSPKGTSLVRGVMPRVGGRMLVLGYLGGCAGAAGMAVYGKGKSPFDQDGIDDRAYRIVKNEKLQNAGNFMSAGAVTGVLLHGGPAGAAAGSLHPQPSTLNPQPSTLNPEP
ncbi:hypothetical protein T484DRAFT_2182519 [Baffinella frigidus]|nr:hypothetical protein T484DRAFT_2182519 [Cryptophyta sp. CCMP2293]